MKRVWVVLAMPVVEHAASWVTNVVGAQRYQNGDLPHAGILLVTPREVAELCAPGRVVRGEGAECGAMRGCGP